MQSKQKNWFFLFFSNYTGVMNDNFLKHCIVFISVTWAMPNYFTQSTLISIVSAALILPYLFFSPLAGHLAVIYPKQKVFQLCKLAEIPIMLLAATAFYYRSVTLCIIVVLIMGIQSCLFSPSKYGLIRDIGGEKGLYFGNGMFEAMAFLGILSGTVGASMIADFYSFGIVTTLFIGFAVLGYITTTLIKVKELEIDKTYHSSINPVKFIKNSYQFAKKNPPINMGILGVSTFWLIGGMIQMNLIIHCTKTLQTSNSVAGLVMAIAAVGIAIGCFLAGKTSKGKTKSRMIFCGLLGMFFFLMCIVIFNPPVIYCAIFVFLMALMGGFFEVPCLAMVQQANIGRKTGEMLAYMNLMIFIFVLAGAGIFFVITRFVNDNSLIVFMVTAGICLLTFFYFLVRKHTI